MRSARLVSLVVSAFLTCSAPALGQDDDFVSLPGLIPATVDFDIEGGHVDSKRWAISCSANVIVGKIRIRTVNGDPKSISEIGVGLNPFPKAPEIVDPSNELFALRFDTTFTNANAIGVFLKVTGKHLVDTHQFNLPLIRTKPLSFKLSWKTPGNVTAIID